MPSLRTRSYHIRRAAMKSKNFEIEMVRILRMIQWGKSSRSSEQIPFPSALVRFFVLWIDIVDREVSQ